MSGFLIRWAICAFGLWVAEQLLEGISFDGAGSLLVAALLLGFVNAVVRPVFVLFTLPLTLLTLGLFLLVVNGLMLALVGALVPGMHVAGLGAAMLGVIIVSLVSWAASAWIGPSGRFEVMVVERRRQP